MSTDYGFQLLKEQEIKELKALAKVFRHSKTGAELLSLTTDDENKVFGITFRTPPSRFHRGSPHIRTLGALRITKIPRERALC